MFELNHQQFQALVIVKNTSNKLLPHSGSIFTRQEAFVFRKYFKLLTDKTLFIELTR